MVSLINPGKVERSAVYEAMDILQNAGYHAERVSTYPKIFDIIAWRTGRTLCICVRSSRQAKLSAFRDYIQAISKMITTLPAPGDVQLWVYRRPGWSRWRVTTGGASPIEQWDISPAHGGVPA